MIVPCLAAATVIGLPAACRAGRDGAENPSAAPRTTDPQCTSGAPMAANAPSAAGEPRAAQDATAATAPSSVPEVVYPSFKIGGFHDFTYHAGRRTSPRGFTMGQYVLHTNSLMAPNIQFFSEVSFTPRSDAGLGSPAAPG